MKSFFKLAPILLLLGSSCTNSGTDQTGKMSNKSDSTISNYDDSFTLDFINLEYTPIPPLNKGFSDRVRIRVTNLSSKDSMFFDCVKDSFIYEYTFGNAKIFKGEKLWATAPLNSLVYYDTGYWRKIYPNFILPKQSKVLLCQLPNKLNSTTYDSVLVGVGFYIQQKEYAKRIIFKVP